MTITKITIIEGEGGILDQADGPINPTATLDAYRAEVLDALAADYPGAELEYTFDGTDAGPRIVVTPGPVTQETEDEVESIRERLGQVYERGTFWVLA